MFVVGSNGHSICYNTETKTYNIKFHKYDSKKATVTKQLLPFELYKYINHAYNCQFATETKSFWKNNYKNLGFEYLWDVMLQELGCCHNIESNGIIILDLKEKFNGFGWKNFFFIIDERSGIFTTAIEIKLLLDDKFPVIKDKNTDNKWIEDIILSQIKYQKINL